MPGGVECLYELNLLHHVGVVAKKLHAVAAAVHEMDDNTYLGPTGRGVKNTLKFIFFKTFITKILETDIYTIYLSVYV